LASQSEEAFHTQKSAMEGRNLKVFKIKFSVFHVPQTFFTSKATADLHVKAQEA